MITHFFKYEFFRNHSRNIHNYLYANFGVSGHAKYGKSMHHITSLVMLETFKVLYNHIRYGHTSYGFDLVTYYKLFICLYLT